ncbi:MAG: hypothetical protein HC809_14520 [Gammaproteobacteria bacterium]|nr:hypothetical protein [Gammaproteobacteria bacterium]
MKLFVPFSESVIERHGFSFSELVPFNAEYGCWRSYDYEAGSDEADARNTIASNTVPAARAQEQQPTGPVRLR